MAVGFGLQEMFGTTLNTWEFDFNDHRRLYAAATTAALRHTLQIENGGCA